MATYIPVLDEFGHAIVYDIFVNGEWFGSRRTIAQCKQALWPVA